MSLFGKAKAQASISITGNLLLAIIVVVAYAVIIGELVFLLDPPEAWQPSGGLPLSDASRLRLSTITHAPSNASSPASSSTFTPSASAFSSFDPASSPATR